MSVLMTQVTATHYILRPCELLFAVLLHFFLFRIIAQLIFSTQPFLHFFSPLFQFLSFSITSLPSTFSQCHISPLSLIPLSFSSSTLFTFHFFSSLFFHFLPPFPSPVSILPSPSSLAFSTWFPDSAGLSLLINRLYDEGRQEVNTA